METYERIFFVQGEPFYDYEMQLDADGHKDFITRLAVYLHDMGTHETDTANNYRDLCGVDDIIYEHDNYILAVNARFEYMSLVYKRKQHEKITYFQPPKLRII